MDQKEIQPMDKKIEQFIEKYRMYIGGGLIVLIVVGGGILLWRENYSKPKLESRILNLESRITELEQQKFETQNIKSETNSNTQVPNDQNMSQEQGQIASATSQSQGSRVGSQVTTSGKININTATAAELDSLPGIGETKANAIIEYRNSHGGFKSIDDLDNVKGIGPATIEKFRDKITCQ